jgi:hypothetical protein
MMLDTGPDLKILYTLLEDFEKMLKDRSNPPA